jgi:deoxyribodipyrimidine photo-lyase
MWFRSDLRVHDNPALYEASENCPEGLMAVYCLTPQTWAQHHEAACKIEFILRNLSKLSEALAQYNIPLQIIKLDHYADCPKALLDFANQHQLGALYFNKQYEFNEQKRDASVSKLFKSHQLEVHSFDEQCILAPGRALNQSGNAFKVFGAFKRKWWVTLTEADTKLYPLPKKQSKMLIASTKVPSSLEGFNSTIDPKLWPAGESFAHKRLKQFCELALFEYDVKRDFPAIEGSSRLSPYLAQGVISAKQCLNAVMNVLDAERPQEILKEKGPETWVNELIWRDFYKHILHGYPRVSKNLPFKKETQKIAWQNDKALFKAWCDGATGYPIVDAAMRQLKTTGWMHNRLRMIVAMFLTKTLLINWQWGEQYFMEHLIDGDFSANNGGWQWSASTGTDSVPYFRIFNPMTQAKKFDPDGSFIKAFCSNYDIKPIVDYKKNRELAIKMFKDL